MRRAASHQRHIQRRLCVNSAPWRPGLPAGHDAVVSTREAPRTFTEIAVGKRTFHLSARGQRLEQRQDPAIKLRTLRRLHRTHAPCTRPPLTLLDALRDFFVGGAPDSLMGMSEAGGIWRACLPDRIGERSPP